MTQRKSKHGVLGLGRSAGLLAAASMMHTAGRLAAQDRAQAISVQELERRQREAQGPSRGEKRQLAARAAAEIQAVAEHTVVLAHIHPRWLRREVEALLDAGQDVDNQDIARIRAQGPRA